MARKINSLSESDRRINLKSDLILQSIQNSILAQFEIRAGAAGWDSVQQRRVEAQFVLVRSIDEVVPASRVFPRIAVQTIDLGNPCVGFESFGNQEVTDVGVESAVEQFVDAGAGAFNSAKVLQPSSIVFRVEAQTTPFSRKECGHDILVEVVDRQTRSQRSGVSQASTIAYSGEILFGRWLSVQRIGVGVRQ